jgi:hypothetical protein
MELPIIVWVIIWVGLSTAFRVIGEMFHWLANFRREKGKTGADTLDTVGNFFTIVGEWLALPAKAIQAGANKLKA